MVHWYSSVNWRQLEWFFEKMAESRPPLNIFAIFSKNHSNCLQLTLEYQCRHYSIFTISWLWTSKKCLLALKWLDFLKKNTLSASNWHLKITKNRVLRRWNFQNFKDRKTVRPCINWPNNCWNGHKTYIPCPW